MTDIVERLRTEKISAPVEHPINPSICQEAADEIERLRACPRCQATSEQTPCAYPTEVAKEQQREIERLREVLRAAEIHVKYSTSGDIGPLRNAVINFHTQKSGERGDG